MQLIRIFDITILNFIETYCRSPLMDAVMPFISSLGNYGFIWILAAVIMICIPKYRKYGIALLCIIIVSSIIGNIILKPLIGRARPFSTYPIYNLLIAPPTDFSFPSGHTVASFASAVLFLKLNKTLGILAFILASLIAFSRLYLYVHYPTDVIAGIFLGILCSSLICRFFFKAKRKK